MPKGNSNSSSATPVIPSWLEGNLKDYTSAVTGLGKKDPSQYVAPASGLQNAAFSRIANGMGRGGYQPGTPSLPSGGSGAGNGNTGGMGLFDSLGVTPSSATGVTDSGLADAKARYTTDPNAKDKVTSFVAPYLDGHNPSFVNAALKGTEGVRDWFDGGGTGLSAVLKNQTGVNLMDPLNITKAIFGPKRRTNAIDQWGTIDQNAGKVGDTDYAAYVDANNDVDAWFNTLKQDDPRGYDYVLKSFDFNGDGNLDKNEAGQFHWQTSGSKEGRAAPQAYQPQPAQQTNPGYIEGPASNVPQQNAQPAGGVLDPSPYIDPNLLYQESADYIRRAGDTVYTPEDVAGPDKVNYRTFDQYDSNVYENPYRQQVQDAAMGLFDRELAGQISNNQARQTLNGSYGGSRHGVIDERMMTESVLDRAKFAADLGYQGYESGRNQFNQDSQGLFSADNINSTNDYNARRLNADNRNQAQIANRDNLYTAGGLLGDVGTTASATERANIMTMLQAGEVERAIDQAQRTGDIQLLAQIGSMLGFNVNSFFGQQNTGPGTNQAMSTLGGAAAGAQVGTSIMPGWGTAIGAIGGGLLGSQG